MQNVNELCMGCMKDNGGAEVCPYCGYREDALQLAPYLPPKVWLEDRYLVGKLLNSNGEGATYLGWDNVMQSPVMIREFLPTNLVTRGEGELEVKVTEGYEATYNSCLGSFLELSRALARQRELSALLPVYDIFEANGTAYNICEYIEHLSLRDFLARNGGTLNWDQARALLMPVLSTLSALHTADIIHRGISPDTLIVGKDGKMRLTGFCTMAERTSRSSLPPELFSGFAAIEQYGFDGQQGPWTDIYGFAATLYRVLVGTNPPEANVRVTNDRMVIPASVAERLPEHVMSAMANALQILPDDRTQTVERFRDELSAAPTVTLNQHTTRFSAVDPQKRDDKKSKKNNNMRYTLIALGCTAVVLGLIVFLVVKLLAPGNPNENSSTPTFSDIVSNDSVPIISSPDPTENVVVPSLAGMNYATAVKEYGDTFNIEVDYKKYDSKTEKGKIMEQNPISGTNIERPENSTEKVTVRVVISLGKNTVTMPDVSGMTYQDAYIALVKLGFSPENITVKEKFSATVEPGFVVETSPILKTTNINVESSVIIYINNRQPEPSSTPEVSSRPPASSQAPSSRHTPSSTPSSSTPASTNSTPDSSSHSADQ